MIVNILEDLLPKEIWNRPKMGFVFPFERWMRENWEEVQQMSNKQDFFDRKIVEGLWKKFKDGHLHWSRVWGLVVMNKFFTSYKEGSLL